MNRRDLFIQRVWGETKQHWPHLNLYERFEQIIAIVLALVISVVIVVAMFELIGKVGRMLLTGMLDPLDHEIFQAVFGAIMTLLIAMEFKHSIIGILARRDSIIKIKTVVFIAILALARKFIILDIHQTSPGMIAALAATILSLAAAYWLISHGGGRE